MSVESAFDISSRVTAAFWRDAPPEQLRPRAPFSAAIDFASVARAPMWWSSSAVVSQAIAAGMDWPAGSETPGAPPTQAWGSVLNALAEPGLLALQENPSAILAQPQPWMDGHPIFGSSPAQTAYGSIQLPAGSTPWFAESTSIPLQHNPAPASWQLLGQLDEDRMTAAGQPGAVGANRDRLMPPKQTLLRTVGALEPRSIVDGLAQAGGRARVRDAGSW